MSQYYLPNAPQGYQQYPVNDPSQLPAGSDYAYYDQGYPHQGYKDAQFVVAPSYPASVCTQQAYPPPVCDPQQYHVTSEFQPQTTQNQYTPMNVGPNVVSVKTSSAHGNPTLAAPAVASKPTTQIGGYHYSSSRGPAKATSGSFSGLSQQRDDQFGLEAEPVIISKYDAGCCSAFNVRGACDQSGQCAFVSCWGCCDRERLVYHTKAGDVDTNEAILHKGRRGC